MPREPQVEASAQARAPFVLVLSNEIDDLALDIVLHRANRIGSRVNADMLLNVSRIESSAVVDQPPFKHQGIVDTSRQRLNIAEIKLIVIVDSNDNRIMVGILKTSHLGDKLRHGIVCLEIGELTAVFAPNEL